MGNVDGSVIIEVKATTDKFEKQLQNLENKYSNKEIELELSEKQLFNAEQDLKSLNDQVEYLDSQYDEINKKLKEQEEIMARIKATPRDMTTIEGRIASNSLDTQYNRALDRRDAAQRNLWRITEEINKQNDLIINQEAVVSKITAKYEKQKNDLAYINQQISNTEMAQSQINTTVEKTSTAHNKTLKSLTKIGLAVFGIRSAYMFVRQAMSYVLSGNQKLSNQMEGIKSSFYNAFTPVIEKIISGIKTLMAYINYLWKALFGKVLFAEKGTTNMSKNLASGAKSAKEINKQLASFDEANVLSNNKDTGAGGIGGGSNGKYDLGLSNIPIPGWLKWIRDFIEKHPTISKIIFGLAAFTLFGGWKIAGGIFGTISSLLGKKGAGAAATGASGLLGVLGTMLLIAATVVICKITYDKVKEAWKAYKDLKKAIDESNETTEKSLKKSEKRQDEIIKETKALNKEDEQHKRNIETLYKMVAVDDEYAHRTFNNKKNEAMANEHLQKTLSKVVTETENMRIAGEMTDEEQYNHYKFLKTYLTPEQINNAEQLGLTAEQAYNLRNGFKELDKKFETKYKLEAETSEAKDKFDDFVKDISNRLSKPIQFQLKANIIGLSDKTVSALKTLGVFHADGGIVNLPGRGVPIAHYAGEAGREGIIPIDNEGQMALLGSEIAKRVTINLTNVTEMNGRTISKELKRIGSESDFAFNR